MFIIIVIIIKQNIQLLQEALEVLRTAPNHVELRVCRPPPDVLSCVSPISEVPPPPPRREPPNSLTFIQPCQLSPDDESYQGVRELQLQPLEIGIMRLRTNTH